eukprot:1265787-Pyramimonas_sp.AAC.2
MTRDSHSGHSSGGGVSHLSYLLGGTPEKGSPEESAPKSPTPNVDPANFQVRLAPLCMHLLASGCRYFTPFRTNRPANMTFRMSSAPITHTYSCHTRFLLVVAKLGFCKALGHPGVPVFEVEQVKKLTLQETRIELRARGLNPGGGIVQCQERFVNLSLCTALKTH